MFILCERESEIIEAETFKKREEIQSDPTDLLIQRPPRYLKTLFSDTIEKEKLLG